MSCLGEEEFGRKGIFVVEIVCESDGDHCGAGGRCRGEGREVVVPDS